MKLLFQYHIAHYVTLMPQHKSELNYDKQSMEHYIERMIGKSIVAEIIALVSKRRIDSND